MSSGLPQAGPQPYPLAETYLALLPRLEKHSAREKLLAHLIPLAILPLALWGIAHWWQQAFGFAFQGSGANTGIGIMGYVMMGLIAVFCLGIASGWGIRLPKLDEQLRYSGLDARLASGALADDRIFEHTAAYLRWLLPRNRPGDQWPSLLRLAGNLEWYLGPPRKHMKQSWKAALGTLPAIAYFLLMPLLFRGFGGPSSVNPFGGMFVMFLAMFPLTQCTFMHMQEQRGRLLADYLRRQLPQLARGGKADGLAGAVPASLAEPGAPRSTTSMQLVLNQLQQDMQPFAQQTVMMPTMLPLMLSMVGMTSSIGMAFRSGFPAFLPVVLGICFCWIPYFIGSHFKKRYAQQLAAELAGSELALRLASGELKDDQIVEYTPLAFRGLLNYPAIPKGYADDLRRVLWRVAFNLDWYMGPPRPLFRRSWIYLIVCVVILVTGFAVPFISLFSALSSVSGNTWSGMQDPGPFAAFLGMLLPFAVTAVALTLGSLLSIEAFKVQTWTEELPRYLRERLAGED